MKSFFTWWLLRLIVPSILSWSLCAIAQTAPSSSQPIRLIVPAAPGGSTDILARSMAKIFQQQTGTSVIVDNRAGAGGAIGVAAVARAPADGLTLLITVPDGVTVLPYLRKDIPYNVERELRPLALIAETSWLFAVNPKVPAKSISELVALAAQRPGAIRFASPGIGTTAHLITEMLALKAHVRMLHVPYKGAGPAATAVITGEVDLIASSPITLKSFVSSGQMRALATTGSARPEVLPDTPTMVESGFPGFSASAWYGLYAPAGISAERAEWLEHAISATVHDPEFQALLKKMGLENR